MSDTKTQVIMSHDGDLLDLVKYHTNYTHEQLLDIVITRNGTNVVHLHSKLSEAPKKRVLVHKYDGECHDLFWLQLQV